MSIFDNKDFDEYAELTYYSRDSKGDTISIERKLHEPDFTTLTEAFLDWAQSVYSWDRALTKLKAMDAIREWEI